MQIRGRNFQHSVASGAGASIGLFDDECDRIRLVEQTEPARHRGIPSVVRIHEHTAAHKNPMCLRDQ